jgi:flagellar hook-length control protein FliK
MSELETGRGAQMAMPISKSALGKLRSIGGPARLGAQTEGLEDVFAQIFSHIAQSKPVESGEPYRSDEQQLSRDPQPISQAGEKDEQRGDDRSLDRHKSIDTQWSDQQPRDDRPVVTDQQPVEQVVQEETAEATIEPSLPVANQQTEQVEVEPELAYVADSMVPAQVDEESIGRRDRGSRETNPFVQETHPVDANSHQTSDAKVDHPAESVSSEQKSLEGEWSSQNDAPDPMIPSRSPRGRREVDRTDGPNSAADQGKSKQDALLKALGSQNANESAASTPADALQSGTSENLTSVRTGSQPVAAATQVVATTSMRASTGSFNGSSSNSNQVRPLQALEGANSTAVAKDPAKSEKTTSHVAETVSRVKLIQRVSKAFQHLGPEGGTVRLRLAPAELGSVRVEMRIQQRKVQARVVAETEAASAALREHLHELRQRLESQGMQIERLDVEVDSGDRDPRGFREHQSEDGHRSPWQRTPRAPQAEGRLSSVNEKISPLVLSMPLATAPASGVDVRL